MKPQTIKDLRRQKANKLDSDLTNEELLDQAKQIVAEAVKLGWIKYGIELTEKQVDNIARRK